MQTNASRYWSDYRHLLGARRRCIIFFFRIGTGRNKETCQNYSRLGILPATSFASWESHTKEHRETDKSTLTFGTIRTPQCGSSFALGSFQTI